MLRRKIERGKRVEGAWLNFRYRVFYPYLREGLTDVEHSNQEPKEVREKAMLILGEGISRKWEQQVQRTEGCWGQEEKSGSQAETNGRVGV